MELLRIEKLYKRYAKHEVLRSCSLSLERGEMLTVIGPSGCGKSTLLSLIAGIRRPDSGRIVLNGELLFSDAEKCEQPPERRTLGFVFQDYALWPHLSVEKHLEFPLEMARFPRNRRKQRVKEMLSLIRLEGMACRHPGEMSGGQQQRLALGRALIMHPPLLLLDEPLSNLDAPLREEMQMELLRLQRELCLTILHVSHDQAEAMAIADRIAVMRDGRFLQVDQPDRVYSYPLNSFVAGFVGSNNILTHGDGRRFLVRPEDVLLCPSPGAPWGGDQEPAEVFRRMYQGAHILYDLHAPGGTIRVRTHPREHFVPGQRVWYSFRRITELGDGDA